MTHISKISRGEKKKKSPKTKLMELHKQIQAPADISNRNTFKWSFLSLISLEFLFLFCINLSYKGKQSIIH